MNVIKRWMLWMGAFTLIFLIACERSLDIDSETEDDTTVVDNVENIGDHDDDADYLWNNEELITIELSDAFISVNGSGATANGSILTISSAGTYSISGSLSDGQIRVNTLDETIVRLILNGVDVSCSSNAAIYVENAEKVLIALVENSENNISDGEVYSSDEEDANAAIFSKSDLTIFGEGSLKVSGNYKDGISSKDGLIITSGNITVNAVDDGVRGKDYLIINNGNMEIIAGDDGLKSDNDEDEGRGYITINDGAMNITAEGDAIQAENNVLIVSGELELISGGGSSAYLSSDASAKGIKSGSICRFYGGEISINAADDAIHSDGDIEIYGGNFFVASGDDGIHSEYDMLIDSGEIYINESYEGLESALGSISINDGYMNIIADDDGINVSAGGAPSGGGGPRKSTLASSSYALNISGGYIVIDCEGDGLDSNELLDISGGTMLVNSDSKTENSSLDYDGSCVVSGGLLVGLGSSQMSMAPGTSSSQYSFLINFKSKLSAGDIIYIQDSDGKDILSYEPHKSYQSLVFSSPDLKSGLSYKVYIGASTTGSSSDGLYPSGVTTGGTLYTSFSISSMVTKIQL